MKVLKSVRNYEKLDDEIRNYFYPKLYKLLRAGKINNGKYPTEKKDEDILTIREYAVNHKEQITILVDIHWCGDVYDCDRISLTEKEWKLIS